MSSNFTISIQDIVNSRNVIGSNLELRLENARSYIFDFNYPVPNDDFKKSLETNILCQFMRYEICVSPFPFWQLQLKSRLNLIMPYYVKLYESSVLEYDILSNIDITENQNTSSSGTSSVNGEDHSTSTNETNGTSSDTSVNSSSQSSNSETLSSNLPQATIGANVDYATESSESTNATETQGNSTTTGTNNQNATNTTEGTTSNTVNSSESVTNSVTRKGFTGSYAQNIKEYRDNLVRIEQMIIEELSDLFFWFPNL